MRRQACLSALVHVALTACIRVLLPLQPLVQLLLALSVLFRNSLGVQPHLLPQAFQLHLSDSSTIFVFVDVLLRARVRVVRFREREA